MEEKIVFVRNKKNILCNHALVLIGEEIELVEIKNGMFITSNEYNKIIKERNKKI